MKLPFRLFSARTSLRISLNLVLASLSMTSSLSRYSGYSHNLLIYDIKCLFEICVKSFISEFVLVDTGFVPLVKLIKLYRLASLSGFIIL